MSQLTVEMALEAVNDVLSNKRRSGMRVDASTSLEELGFDSLEVAELFSALEDRCEYELDPDSAQALLTVGDLAQLRAADSDASVASQSA